MRCARLLGVLAVSGLLAAPSTSTAQEAHPFTNSWFWGAKAGVLTMNTQIERANAPVIGAEWLITRSKYGLYIGLDQAYFDAVSTVTDAGGADWRVDIRDLRRLTASMYLFPKHYATIRPYVGLGYSFNFIVRAAPQSNLAGAPVLSQVEGSKTRVSPVGTLGLQWNMVRMAPFVQATVMPTRGSGAFLINGETFAYYVEAGIRYNFGSSIEVFR
jgi:hypothetical protein